MSRIGSLLRAARRSRNLTQREVAGRLRIDQGRVSKAEAAGELEYSTIERLLAASGHRLYSAPTRRDDVASAGAAVRSHLRNGDRQRALRTFIQLSDDLAAEQGLVRGVLCLAEPESTGDPAWDAALAALVALRLNEERLPRPEWVDAEDRRLSSPRTLAVDAADPLPAEDDVPAEFFDRGVLIWADTLASV